MLDERGNLMLKSISRTSGSPEVDQAVEQALAGIQVSELPPEEMPKVLKIKVTFKS